MKFYRCKRSVIPLLVICCLLAATLIGCGGDQAVPERDDEAEKEYEPLQIYAAYMNEDNILEEFKKATGISAEYVKMSSGEVLSRMRAEKGRPLGDIWFGGGVDSFMVAAEEGLLESYHSPEAEYIDEQFKDPDGYWTGISIVLVTLVANKEMSEELGISIPQKMEELVESQYMDEILMPNPGISGTAFTFIASILQIYGEEDGWEYLDKLDENTPFYAERGGEPPQKAALGEVMMGVSPDGIHTKHEGYPVEIVYPSDGTPWWHSPVAIMKGTDNLEAAQKFVDWALSEEGQEVLARECPRPSPRPGTELPEGVPELETLNLVDYDFEWAAEKRDDIVDEWSRRYE